MEYLKFLQKKIKTNNKIPIGQVEKIIYISYKYTKVTHCSFTLTQIWQNFQSIKSLIKMQY